MKAQLDWRAYRNLEFGTQQNPRKNIQKKPQPTRISFYDIWQIALTHLTMATEPRVWKTQDETGQTVWSAYDPRTEKAIHQVSAERVRAWLHL